MNARPEGQIERTLARYRDIVSRACRARLDDAGPSSYLAPLLSDYPSRGGKGLRASLCLAVCEAFGGRITDALPSATSIELLHNAFLIHDDIEDASLLRRGQPTLHRQWGTPLALNAGDGLAQVATATLHESLDVLGPRLTHLVVKEFDFMNRQTVAGQALELGWQRDNRLDLTPAHYFDLIMKKTCWYTTVLPLRVGALIGSWGTADLEPFIAFGFHLGAAFQIRDDILNLTQDTAGYGKEPLGDLLEGKRTLMLLHLLAASPRPERKWLEGYLARSRLDRRPDEAAYLYELMEAHGSLAFATVFASGMASAAALAMEYAFAGLPDSPAREFIRQVVPYMVERTA